MTESTLFKDYYNVGLAERMAARIMAVYPPFNAAAFVAQIAPQLDGQEMKARTLIFTHALHDHLPPDFPAAWAVLQATLDAEPTDSVPEGGWHYWPMAQLIELYGLEHFDDAMQAMHEITRRHTAEFAIRPFLIRYPDRTLAVLHEWTQDANHHVRRLVSEGTRPRLPWGMRLNQFIADPTPTLSLLEKLKDDPSEYVRRSVANHLNDITKDNAHLALATLTRWQENPTPERQWITRHALRSLVKAGDPAALELLGYGAVQVSVLQMAVSPSTLTFGNTLEISFTLQSDADARQDLVVDYVIHFVKANGRTAPKVFKLRNVSLDGRQSLPIRKNHAFKPITTRRYYPGLHRVEIQVNGQTLAGADFELIIE
ncbi:MAG TPA: hypothetical protein PLD25_14965 [Chloroflexota bacterium]|nr:hypothetical protein [Chloroflexota bacterium]